MQKKAVKAEQQEIFPPDGITQGLTDAPLDYDSELQDFLNATADLDRSYSCQVFRMEYASKNRLFYLANFSNSIPTYQEIGEKFGAGSYVIQVVYFNQESGKRSSKSKTIHIADDAMFKRRPEIGGPPAAQVSPAGSISPLEMMRFMQAQFQMTLEIVGQITASKQDNGGNDLRKAMQDIAINNLKSQNRLVDEMTKMKASALLAPPGDDDDLDDVPQAEKENVIHDLLKMLIDKFSDAVLNSNAITGKFMKKQIVGSEEFKFAASSPEAFAAAFEKLSDKEKKTATEMMQKLGITLPGGAA